MRIEWIDILKEEPLEGEAILITDGESIAAAIYRPPDDPDSPVNDEWNFYPCGVEGQEWYWNLAEITHWAKLSDANLPEEKTKTEIVREFAKANGIEVIECSPVLNDPKDCAGLPQDQDWVKILTSRIQAEEELSMDQAEMEAAVDPEDCDFEPNYDQPDAKDGEL